MNIGFKKKSKFEFKVTIIYMITGSLWILFSDRLAFDFIPGTQNFYLISTYKGWFFVFITGILLYILIRKESIKRNAMQEQLLLANRKANESDMLKSAFLSNLSHYIRTPMNSILGFVELLKYRNLDTEKKEKFMTIIDEQSQELLQLISNMIEVSKIQEGQLEIEEASFSLNSLMRKLYLTFEVKLNRWKPGVTLQCDTTLADKNDFIVSDYAKLFAIFSNLLGNALKFTTFGIIEYGYVRFDDYLECYVSDTGCGISEEKRKYIFDKFLHSNYEKQISNEGSSLGLFLSSGLARSLGGKLWLEYSSSAGTKFKFIIPIKSEV